MAFENNFALRLWLGIAFLLILASASSARDIRHVEFVRYGQNNPYSPTKAIIRAAEWLPPLTRPGFFELGNRSDVSFITRTTLYLDRETLDVLAPDRAGAFATLINQDMARVASHPGLSGAPLLVCFYGPRSRDWGQPSGIPSDVPLEVVLAHAQDVQVNLYWHIIDHPPYQAIPGHPLRRIGAFRSICPGEAGSPLVRQYERFVRGTIEWTVKRGLEFNAPVRGFGQAPPSIPITIGLEYRVAIQKMAPRVSSALGGGSGPLSDPPPLFLRYNMTSVTYQRPGSSGLVGMDFVPIQFMLTKEYSKLPRAVAAQVTPEQVARARSQNAQQMYHVCNYRQGNAAYWVWSDAFDLRAQGFQMRPAKGSSERPIFACPIEPGQLWR